MSETAPSLDELLLAVSVSKRLLGVFPETEAIVRHCRDATDSLAGVSGHDVARAASHLEDAVHAIERCLNIIRGAQGSLPDA